MLIIRNLIYWAFLCICVPVTVLCLILGFFLPGNKRHYFGAWCAQSLLFTLDKVVGLKYEVIGRENIPNEPAIICSKHQSGWETFALQKIFPHQVFVCKRELLRLPFFGWGLAMMNPIAINRSNPAQANRQITEQGLARKKQGFWITIFPEGTRIQPGVRGKYKQGAARLAKATEMDMVPVAHNSGEFWPKNSFLKYPGTITVVIGKPISYAVGGPEVLMQKCEEWIESRQREIGGKGPFAHKNEIEQDKQPTPPIDG